MTRDRRFGIALFVLALGNAMLAFGNYVGDGNRLLVVVEAVVALGLTVVSYSFVYGDSELAVGESNDRIVAAATVLIAAVGVVIAVAGFYLAIGQ